MDFAWLRIDGGRDRDRIISCFIMNHRIPIVSHHPITSRRVDAASAVAVVSVLSQTAVQQARRTYGDGSCLTRLTLPL
jgi:hypothetical protein